MYTLKAEKRNTDIKAKKLRKEGFVPATISGKSLDNSVLLQLTKADATQFVNRMAKGSRLTIESGSDSYDVLFKDISHEPVSGSVEQIEFQLLVAGEPVNSVMKVVLENKDSNKNLVHQVIEEIPYKALPKDFVQEVMIDLDGVEAGTTITIGDLEVAKNEAIKLALPEDTVVVTVQEPRILSDEEVEGTTDEEAPTEPEVVGEEAEDEE